MKIRFVSFVLLFIALSSCKHTKNKADEDIITPIDELYAKGVAYLEDAEYKKAAAEFEKIFYQHPGNPKVLDAELMEAYALFLQKNYTASEDVLKLFLALHESSKDKDYVYYMLGYNNFCRRENNKLDQTPLKDAKKYFKLLIEYYPHSKYVLDAREKIKIINNYIAGHELYIARNYLLSQRPIASLNRLKLILTDYSETVYAPEAFYRPTEACTALGLYDEAAKYSATLQKKHQNTIWAEYSAKLIARKK